MEWLAWPGWNGIAAIATLIALAGLGLAAWQILDSHTDTSGHGIHTQIDREKINDMVKVTLTCRSMGNKALFEVEWLANVPFIRQPPVRIMTVRDDPIRLELWIPTDKLPHALVGITWIEPNRYGSKRQAERWGLAYDSDLYERWSPPHPHHIFRIGRGHWVRTHYRADSPLLMPPMNDH